jgi:hypothetical protein
MSLFWAALERVAGFDFARVSPASLTLTRGTSLRSYQILSCVGRTVAAKEARCG